MAVTILTPSASTNPTEAIHPVVQIKEGWQDNWQTALELQATNLSTAAAAHDLSRLTFHRKYGYVKDTYESDFPESRLRVDLTDWWVRVRAPTADALDWQTVWLGRISGEESIRYASTDVPAGMQQWVAYGPGQILRKRAVGQSYHDVDRVATLIGWVPPLNTPSSSETGNRSRGLIDGVYLYGWTDVQFTPYVGHGAMWTYRQYVDYLLKMFVDESATNGPEWKLTGQADILDQLRAPIRWGTTQTVYQMLRKLIPQDRGVDYTIRTVGSHTPSEGANAPEAGFEVYVYSVSPEQYTFAGATIPQNMSSVTIDASSRDLTPPPTVAISHDRKYKRIRVLGKRIVVCCTLWGKNAVAKAQSPYGATGVPPVSGSFPSLVEKWQNWIEGDYKYGGPVANSEADHDAYRRQDKFRDIYTALGAPADWDLNVGHAAPWCDDQGELRLDDSATLDEWEHEAPYQLAFRRTLSWIPLKEGEDWTKIAGMPTESRGQISDVDDHQAAYQRPIVWLFDPDTYSYMDSTKLGIGVRPMRYDWGVLLQCSPNHIMAENHFGEEGGTSVKTATWPRYDYEEVAATIAFEADQRYTMEWATEDATNKDGVFEIEVDAEMHYLAPNTIVATPYPDSTPAVVLSGDQGRVIRADRGLMGLVMAGAIARYGYGRNRAVVSVAGLQPWHDLIGQILWTVEESDNVHFVNGPISGCTWQMSKDGPGRTIIKAGYAK